MMAGTMGALVVMLIGYLKTGKFDPGMMANGLLAGLVAITAPSAFVNSIGSVAIGSIAGILVYYGYNFIDRKLKIDDPVGAIAVHGINGAWGVISVGIFADGSYGDGWNGVPGTVKGILYGDGSQLVAQLIGTATCFVFVYAAMWSWFKISNKITPIRVKADEEIMGLGHTGDGCSGLCRLIFLIIKPFSLKPLFTGALFLIGIALIVKYKCDKF